MKDRSEASGSALTGRRILIVEDELLLAMEISSALEATGCTVLGPAKNEAQAMALLGQGPPPDAVLLDLNLAGASSAPIAVELRARGIPFVVTSGYTQSLATEPALHDAAWLNKPIEHDRLVRMLRRLLEPNPG